MKRIILLALLLVVPAGAAFADPDIGCGLGTQVWEGNKGLAPKVLGATTNGLSGNQTFGITFNTIGCHSTGAITADARLHLFAGANLDHLARDMANGQGETLDAFAQLMNVQASDRAAFNEFTRAHFPEIFAGEEEVTAAVMLTSLRGLLAQDQRLAGYAGI
jgi:hypothetical protein